MYTWTAADGDTNTAADDIATLTFTITVAEEDIAPTFDNVAMFTTAIEAAENQTAAGAATFFAATGTAPITLTLGGTDAGRFFITAAGTLTFDDAPDFEMPRGTPITGTNTNNYALTVIAMNSVSTVESGAITVTVTDVNEAPVLSAIPTPTFTEYSAGGFTIAATDVDRPAQTLAFALTGDTHGAALTTGGGFTWTPREMDGTVARTFNVTVTDSGTPPQTASTTFAITAAELANRAPTGVMITNTDATIQNPATLVLSATASDPDTGTTLTYTWSASADGGTFSPATGASVTWTPPSVMTATTVTLTVTVSDGTATATDMHDISVTPADTAPTFGGATIADQTYITGETVALTLPFATGGNDGITYTLTPALPAGLTHNGTARTITGNPTATLTATMFTYTAADGDGNTAADDTATLTFTITVETDTAPAFATGATIAAQTYVAGLAIEPLTLAAATDGNGALIYTLTPAIAGLTLDPTSRVLTGTPTTVATATMYTYTATDGDMNTAADDTATLTFSITVEANTAPAFGSAVPSSTDLVFRVAQMVAHNLPEATGGNGAITYTLNGMPPGLTFDGVARPPTLTGTPTAIAAAGVYTYTVRDADDDTDSRSFRISVDAEDTAPTFGDATTPAQTYVVNSPITPLTLPAATGGNGPGAITYTLTTPPVGLTFDAATRVLSGTPTNVAAAMMYTWTAADGDMNTAADDEVSLTFSITVEADTAPDFGRTTPFEPTGTIAQNRMITPITLPEIASGGNGDITYTLAALPTGLTFDAATRPPTISGTPQDIVAEMDYTYTAADSDGNRMSTDEDTLIVRFEVIQTPPIEIRLSVNPAEVTESSAATTITLTATLIDGSFSAERNITVASTDGTATAGTDYTAVSDTTLTIPANAASGSVDIMFTAGVDTDDEPSGETVSIGRSVTTGTGAVDSEIPVTPATLTINDYTPVTVNAGADRTVVYGGTITLNGEFDTGIADAITWALSDGAATIAAFEAAGLTNPQATAEVMRLTNALATLTTLDATLTAPAESLGLTDSVTLAFTVTVTDNTAPTGQPAAAATDMDEVMITVVQDTAPVFAASASIPAQNYTVGTAITTLTLPAIASGGNGAIIYTLTRPAGLAFDSATRVLTGTPTTAIAATTFIYTAADSDMNTAPTDTATLTFSITVDAAPGVTFEQANDITRNEIILPEVARALVHSTTTSITRRVGQAVGNIPVPTVGSFNLAGQEMGGQDNLARALQTHGEAMSADNRDIKEMLSGSDFVVPLNATDGSGSGASVAFWGSGEYRDFSGESDNLEWDGDLTGAQLGLDARLHDNLLVGVAVSWLETEMEYADDTGLLGQGDYQLDLTSAHPYIGWRAGELDLWATVGYGTGELEITAEENGVAQTPKTGDVNLQTVGGGGSGMLWQSDATKLRLKGEVAQATLEVEKGDAFAEQEIDATSARLALEMSWTNRLTGGGIFEPSLEVAARHDGGDGATGGGAEIGGGLRYNNPVTRFTAESRIRALVGQGGNYEEWGVSGTLRVGSGPDGQGLSFSLSPGYGDSGSGIQELWRHGLADENNATDETDDYAMKLDARMGYGVAIGEGVLTPYSEMTHGTTDSYRMGLNWKAGERFDLTMLSERRENTGNPAEHTVLLKGEVRF